MISLKPKMRATQLAIGWTTDNQVEVTNLVNEFGSTRGKIKEQATLKLFVAFYEFLKKFQRLNRCWM